MLSYQFQRVVHCFEIKLLVFQAISFLLFFIRFLRDTYTRDNIVSSDTYV